MVKEKEKNYLHIGDSKSDPLVTVNGKQIVNGPANPAGHFVMNNNEDVELTRMRKTDNLSCGIIVAICGFLLAIVGIVIMGKVLKYYNEPTATSVNSIDVATPIKPVATVNGQPISNDADHPAGYFKLKDPADGVQGNMVAPPIDSDGPGEHINLEDLLEDEMSSDYDSVEGYLEKIESMNN